MLTCPFDLVSCSWPRPMQPGSLDADWATPLIPSRPPVFLEMIDGDLYWTMNWQEFFRNNLVSHAKMRSFYVVFQLRLHLDGMLVFTEAHCHCAIRRAGIILHETDASQPLSFTSIVVKAGDLLEVAQWHEDGEWMWGASLQVAGQESSPLLTQVLQSLQPYREQVQEALRRPNGPALKILMQGEAPMRTITAIYSLILNGYVPSQVYLFGDHQWHPYHQIILNYLLPFARIVSTAEVVKHVETLGAAQLTPMITAHWIALKTAIALLYPPHEFCMMDDDIFVLGRMDDALEAFSSHNLVFTSNRSFEKEYVKVWNGVFKHVSLPLATARLNAGLYWLRNTREPRELAHLLQQVPVFIAGMFWEQGFIALTYADSCFELPLQQYAMPAVVGLPGGILGYDYLHNPCKFTILHFAGGIKPSNGASLHLLPQIIHADSVLA